jgi:signal transduction histidine kinase
MLKVLVASSGWILLVLYLLYERQEYGGALLHHLFSPGQSAISMFFHLVMVSVPAASTYMAYLIRQREVLMRELARGERLQALGEMSQGIAHDFDSLLGSASEGIVRAVEQQDRPGERADSLDEVRRAILEARELAGELRDFSTGVVAAQRTVLVENVVRRACVVATGNTASECRYEFPDDLWPVEADEGSLMSAIAGVVGSAVRMAPQGVVVLVRCENVSLRGDTSLPLSRGQYVNVSVRVPGSDVPAEKLERLFDPYGVKGSEGRGFGLARAFSVVRRHGGHLTASYQKGSIIISAYLPVARLIREDG